VYACPHDAAHRVNPLEFFGGLLQRQKINKADVSKQGQ
jgi:hypothetical protein